MANVARLGYLGFEVTQPEAFVRCATETIGLVSGGRAADGALILRVDGQAQRLRVHAGPADDIAYLGWEVADRAALDAMTADLTRAGVALRPGTAEQADARGVDGFVALADPDGVGIELFCGPRLAAEPFRSPLVRSGFITRDEGVGHVLMFVKDAERTRDFYCRRLGLKISDYVDTEVGGMPIHATFLHANTRHHSLAFTAAPVPKHLHHFMLEMAEIDAVGAAYDRALANQVPIMFGLGRHPNDRMLSFYGVTPAGFAFELGWGARKVDDADWEVRRYDRKSDWGHHPAQIGGH